MNTVEHHLLRLVRPSRWGGGASSAPAIVCALIVVLGGLAVALVAVQVDRFLLDEVVYRVSAVRYEQGLPGSLLHDAAARSAGRLYPASLMPLFRLFDGDVAIRLAKVWNVVLWCSVAVPLWRLTRPVLTPWRRCAAVSLSVLAPWIVLTTALFTEAMALAAFAWFTLAAVQAARRPAWWRDGLVVLALAAVVTSRVQLAGVLPGYLVLVALAARGLGVRETLRRFPFTIALLAGGVLAAAGLAAAGRLGSAWDSLAGSYAGMTGRRHVLADGASMVLVEVLAFSVGLGVAAVLAALAWYRRTIVAGRRVVGDDVWWYAVGTLAIGAALLAATAVAQGGFWGVLTEERYWIYPYLFAWPAALAVRRAPRALELLVVGALLVAAAALVAPPRRLDAESVFFAPVLATLGSVSSTAAPIAGLVAAACAAAGLALRRGRLAGALAGGAAVQLALLVTVLLALTGAVAGGGAQRTGAGFADLAWADRAADGRIAWLESLTAADRPAMLDAQRETLLWNGDITVRAAVEGSHPAVQEFPLNAVSRILRAVDPASGVLAGPLPRPEVLAWTDSPYVQLRTRPVAVSPRYPRLGLYRPGPRPQLLLRSSGLAAGDRVVGGRPVGLSVWPGGAGARVTLRLEGSGRVTVRPGVRVPRSFAVAGVRSVTVGACGGRIELTLAAAGRSEVRLGSVRVRPLARCAAGTGDPRR